MKPLVYLAGPFSKPIPTHNVAEAVTCARLLERLGLVVFVPHLSALSDMISPRSYEEWMEYDLEIICRCDALFRMRGASDGADAEVAFAVSIDVPVFSEVGALSQWAEARATAVEDVA